MKIYSKKKQTNPYVEVEMIGRNVGKSAELLKMYTTGKYTSTDLVDLLREEKIPFQELIKLNLPRTLFKNWKKQGRTYLKYLLRLSTLLDRNFLEGLKVEYKNKTITLDDELIKNLLEIEGRRQGVYSLLHKHDLLHSKTDPPTLYLINNYGARKNDFVIKLMEKFHKLTGSYQLIALSLAVDKHIVADWYRRKNIPLWFALFISVIFGKDRPTEKIDTLYEKEEIERRVVQRILSGELQEKINDSESYEKLRKRFEVKIGKDIRLLPFRLLIKNNSRFEGIIRKAKERIGSTELLITLTNNVVFDRGSKLENRMSLYQFLKVCKITGLAKKEILGLIKNPKKKYQRFEVKNLDPSKIKDFASESGLKVFENTVLLDNCKQFQDILSDLIERFSVNNLSNVISRHPDTIYRWRGGHANPRLADVRKVCELMGIDFKGFLLNKTILPESTAYGQGCNEFRIPTDYSDKDIMYLVGIIIADGSITKNQTYIYSEDKKYRRFLYEKINKTFDLTPIESHSYVGISSTAFSYWLSLYFNVPIGSKNETISIAEELVENNGTSLLRGLFDGDGSIDLNSGKIIYGTKSLGLALYIYWKLEKLGFKKHRFVTVDTESYLYEIALVPNELERFKDLIGFDFPSKKQKLNNLVGS